MAFECAIRQSKQFQTFFTWACFLTHFFYLNTHWICLHCCIQMYHASLRCTIKCNCVGCWRPELFLANLQENIVYFSSLSRFMSVLLLLKGRPFCIEVDCNNAYVIATCKPFSMCKKKDWSNKMFANVIWLWFWRRCVIIFQLLCTRPLLFL